MIICTRRRLWAIMKKGIATVPDVRAAHLTGDSRDEERMKALNDMRAGDLDVLLVMNIFDMGVNLPGLDVLWMPQPTSIDGWKKLNQRTGRALRKKTRDKSSDEHVKIKLLAFDDSERYWKQHEQVRRMLVDHFGFQVTRVNDDALGTVTADPAEEDNTPPEDVRSVAMLEGLKRLRNGVVYGRRD
jgi:superfamily II DNA or RNA helicase